MIVICFDLLHFEDRKVDFLVYSFSLIEFHVSFYCFQESVLLFSLWPPIPSSMKEIKKVMSQNKLKCLKVANNADDLMMAHLHDGWWAWWEIGMMADSYDSERLMGGGERGGAERYDCWYAICIMTDRWQMQVMADRHDS